MNTLYTTIRRGQETRSRIIETLRDGMTREELAKASGLTYEQVRNQTLTLVNEGAIVSRMDGRKRRYYRKSLVMMLISCALLEFYMPEWGKSRFVRTSSSISATLR